MKAYSEMTCELVDPITNIKRKAVIKAWGDGQIGIHIDGFGENTSSDDHAEPILIDLNNNKLQVFIWSNINDEEPTHKVDMTGARVEKRVKD